MKTDRLASHASRRRLGAVLIAALGLIAGQASLSAASATWIGGNSTAWSDTANWSATPVPGTSDTATFNSSGGNTTIDLGSGVTIGAILFDTSSAAAYTIGNSTETLTLGTVGNAVTMNSTVASNETIAASLALATAGTYIFTNNSATNTLTLSGGISATTSGNAILEVAGSGNTTISGAVTSGSGAVGLLDLGTGTLTLSGGGVFNGSMGTTYGPSSAFVIRGTTVIASGAYSSSLESVIGGVVTAGAAGVNASLTLNGTSSFTTTNYLSLGRGNGNGSDGVTSTITLNGNSSITAAQFSAGYNANSTANKPSGSFTLNGNSTFTVGSAGQFTLGESAGSNFTITLNDYSTLTITGAGSATNRAIGDFGTGVLTLNGNSTANLGTSIMNVGYQTGNGTLSLNGGNLTLASELRVAASNTNGLYTASGTVNVAGGTMNLNALTLARANDITNASTLTALFNQTGGTVNIANGGTLVGWEGQNSTGTLSISGGVFNQSTTATSGANITIGSFGSVTGSLTVSGTGALNLDGNSSILFAGGASDTGANTLTISGGNVTFYSNAGSTIGGAGVIDLMNTAASATNTVNLNGGTLTANQIKSSNSTGTRVVNFNGGTLVSGSSSLASAFFASGVATTANVRNGGAIINTNGNSVTIGQALVHSTIGGDNATDGGLTKLGAGTLTLTSANTYTGVTTVSAGTLATGSTGTFGAGNITVGTATLTLGNAASIADTSTLTFNSTLSTITLSFTGAETLANVYNSVTSTYLTAGTWSAAQLNTYFNTSAFSGTGELTVTASAIPEPATYAALAGLSALGLAFWRRRKD